MQKLGTEAKLVLHWIVGIGGNTLIFTIIPADWKPMAALVFNLAMISYAFFDPTYAVHLIQTGQMKVPPAPSVPSTPTQS